MPKSQTVVLLGGYISFNGAVKVPFEIWKYDAAVNSWQLVKAIQSGSLFPDFNGWRYRCPMVAADTSDNIIALADTSGFYSQYRPMTYKLHFSATEVDAAGTSTYGITDGAAWHPSGNLDPAWYSQGVPAVDTAANELSLRNIQARTWTAVVPPKMPAGGRDYGTTVIDPDHDLILKFAGGHSAVPYNDVPQYSISENRYSLGYAPVTMLEHNGIFGINGYTFDNRPFLAIHTWHAYSYSEKLKRMVFVKGDLTYTYDPVKKDWDSLHIPAPAAGYTIGTPHGVFALGSYGIYLLDSLRGTWRQSVATNWAYNSGCDLRDYGGICYDSKRDRVLVFASCAANAAPKILEYSYTTNTVSSLYPGDSNLVKNSTAYSYLYEASAYLPGSDKILFMGTAGQNGSTYVHYLLNCATNKWETQTVTAPAAMWERGLSGMAFMYDAKRNLVWCSDAQCKLYALRMDAFTTASKQNTDELAEFTKLIVSPNPFNPVTSLNVELPFSGDINLAVYEADGTFIREIASGYFMRGKYSFGWQGNNQRNGRAATGVYFCKLTAGKSTITVKTVITK
jgi:hypothetical protein